MIIAAIGDRHGKDFGRKFLDDNILNPNIDKFVFMSDYFDSYDKTLEQQIDVFNDDMWYKTLRPNDVFYLKANHDAHYITSDAAICSGFQHNNQFKIKHILNEHWNTFKHLVYFDGWLFSHAGVTNTLRNVFTNRFGEVDILDFVDMANQSNNKAFYRCDDNGYGKFSGSMWVRPKRLFKDLIPNINQCYGHTYNDNMVVTQHGNIKTINIDCSGIVLIDTLTNTFKKV